MDIYFSPLACSLASRITLYETGQAATFHRVDTKTGKTASGDDYRAINPKNLVPALRTDDGAVLTENAAILPYLADRRPDAGLAPTGFARYQLQQWLSFIGSELHKWVFTPLLSPTLSAESKAVAKDAAASRLAYLNDHLTGRDWLLDDFSVADAYLAAVLNWNQAVKLDFSPYPAIQAYQARLMTRPAVQKAMGEEFALYQAA
ncbi:glutathione binding-like protein [Phenylobacterium sp.]|uniref:glutathione binding-like protein n=1 Tax=Phenylobacterium sp. TaxID=1871053 RepID=UPI003BAA198B